MKRDIRCRMIAMNTKAQGMHLRLPFHVNPATYSVIPAKAGIHS